MTREDAELTIKEVQEAFPHVYIYQDVSPVPTDPENVFVWISNEDNDRWYRCGHIIHVYPGWVEDTRKLLTILGIAQ